MSAFAVILNNPEEAETIGARIEREYPEPNHLSVSPTAWLISGDLLIQEIVEKLGLRTEAESPVLGVVLRLNGTYAGYNEQSVWDWLARSAAKA